MNTFNRQAKESQLRNNIEMAVEREMRSIEKNERRQRKPGEKDKLKKKWVDGATRIDKSGKLSEVWNPKTDNDQGGLIKGYFGGVNIINGKIVK